jgi:hypothetical protein
MKLLLMGAAILAATTGMAQAQTTSGFRWFADGGALVDIDPYTYDYGSADASAGFSGSVGGIIGNGWSVRFETTRPTWHKDDVSSYRSTATTVVDMSGTNRHRISTYTFLAGKDFGLGRRVTLTPLFGASAARHSDREESVVITNRSGVVTNRSDSSNYHETLGLFSGGADAAFAVTPRIAVVPHIRVHVDPRSEDGSAIVRPGLAFRVRF